MTRAEVLEQYQVSGGSITSPGKFEGEAIWVPAFWAAATSEWPELAPETYVVIVWEDDQGFVYGVEQDAQEFKAWMGQQEATVPESETPSLGDF